MIHASLFAVALAVAPADAVELTYRVDEPAPDPAVGVTPSGARAHVLEARLKGAGLERVAVEALDDDAMFRLRVDPADAATVRAVKALFAGPDALAFRVVADERTPELPDLTARLDEALEAAGGATLRRADLDALGAARDDGDRLVWLPTAADQGDADDEAPYRLVEVPKDGGFTGRDVESTFVTRDGAGHPAIGIHLREDRAAAFQTFTRANLKRKLAIVVAGEVHSAPLLMSPIGRAAVISGGGNGFTDGEIGALRAALGAAAAGPAVTLVAERRVQSG